MSHAVTCPQISLSSLVFVKFTPPAPSGPNESRSFHRHDGMNNCPLSSLRLLLLSVEVTNSWEASTGLHQMFSSEQITSFLQQEGHFHKQLKAHVNCWPHAQIMNRMEFNSALQDERRVKLNPFPAQVKWHIFSFCFFFLVLKLIADTRAAATNGNWGAAEFMTTREASGVLITKSQTLFFVSALQSGHRLPTLNVLKWWLFYVKFVFFSNSHTVPALKWSTF